MGYQKACKVLVVFPKEKEQSGRLIRITARDPEIVINRRNKICMLEKATEEGHARLQYQLGKLYEQKNDYFNAFKWFNLAAEIEVTDAYYKLGIIFEEGKGIEQSYTAAASMYQKATERDHADACYRLGLLYQYGNGADQNYSKAYSFYKKAAEMNHDLASKVLNIRLEAKINSNENSKKDSFNTGLKQYKESLLMCMHVAEHGNTDEQFRVGFAYEKNYTEPDYVESFKWYSMASRSSHKEAIYRLGLQYEKGLGVLQDYHRAIQLYNQAYQLGSDDALHRLGTVHHHGKGLETNSIKAIEYYINSAERGNPKYQCELGRLYEEGELVRKNLLESLKWYTKAYLQGYDNIRSQIYAMYDDEPYESFFWKKLFRILSIASCNPFGLGKKDSYNDYGRVNNRLGTLYFYGQGREKNLTQALEYFTKGYSFYTDILISSIGFLLYDGLTSSQKNEILDEFEGQKMFITHINTSLLYELGMVYRDGLVETQNEELKYEDRFSRFGKHFIYYQDQVNPNESIIIEKNHFKSFNYFKKAANRNHPEALLQLGIMYHCGYGVDKDIEQGEKNFENVSDIDTKFIGHIATAYHIHNGLQNFSKACKWYQYLEKSLRENLNIPDDDRKALNKQVNSGLGLLYEYGVGVEQNYQKALEYYKKLADDNSTRGFYHLALMHYYGKVTPVDYKEAFNLFQKSLSLGLWDNKKIVFVYYQNHSSSSGSHRSMTYCTKSERDMLGEVHYYLGLMYKNGQGTIKDEVTAQRYFESAVKRGCKRAENEIEDDILNLK